ncbi:hypothetical protein GGX14DRAFT_407637 [Mycena pura]|uniref:Uncharacterized protein n=1 Tax=Mycena pura TaxID=153505 RepID=A0AAD6UN56_9AGAR|nr:hypothetical protein GGX14DRAFT_407637 [Mycena pura]
MALTYDWSVARKGISANELAGIRVVAAKNMSEVRSDTRVTYANHATTQNIAESPAERDSSSSGTSKTAPLSVRKQTGACSKSRRAISAKSALCEQCGQTMERHKSYVIGMTRVEKSGGVKSGRYCSDNAQNNGGGGHVHTTCDIRDWCDFILGSSRVDWARLSENHRSDQAVMKDIGRVTKDFATSIPILSFTAFRPPVAEGMGNQMLHPATFGYHSATQRLPNLEPAHPLPPTDADAVVLGQDGVRRGCVIPGAFFDSLCYRAAEIIVERAPKLGERKDLFTSSPNLPATTKRTIELYRQTVCMVVQNISIQPSVAGTVGVV